MYHLHRLDTLSEAAEALHISDNDEENEEPDRTAVNIQEFEYGYGFDSEAHTIASSKLHTDTFPGCAHMALSMS